MSLKRCQGLLKRLYKQGKAEIQEKNETDWCTPTIERLAWLKNTYGVYVIHPSFRIIALARPPLGLFKIQKLKFSKKEHYNSCNYRSTCSNFFDLIPFFNVFYCVISFKQAQNSVYTNCLFFLSYNSTTFAQCVRLFCLF